MNAKLTRWRLLAVLFVALVAIDQWTKFLAVERLTTALDRAESVPPGHKVVSFYRLRHLEPLATAPYYVYQPLWRMNYVENPGAAWGMFRGLSEGFRNAFFGIISVGAVVFILRYYRKLREDQRFLQVSLSFVLAGAVGNFIDRIARRYVIDFVEWYWWNRPDIRWPTFNVADSLIVVGVAMLILHPGTKGEESRGAEKRDEEAPPA